MPLRLPIEQANRFVLRKQHLTPESRGGDVLTVARDVGPIRATPTISPYLALWSRLRTFEREQLDAALYEVRSLVRVPCMAARLYVAPARDLPAYYRLTKRLLPNGLQYIDNLLADGGALQDGSLSSVQLAQRVLEIMTVRDPSTVAELAELLPALNTPILHDPAHPELGCTRLGARLLPAMCTEGLLVRAQTRGGWRSDLFSYAALSSWLSGVDVSRITFKEGLRHVLRAYIAAFGPVSVGDMLHWLGGVDRRHVVASLMALGTELARVQIADSPGEYFVLAAQVPALLDNAPMSRNVFLLPQRDSLVAAYSDARRFLPELYREFVFDRASESLGTAWVDGRIAGVWDLHIREERIGVRLLESVDPEALALVGEEARRLAKFLAFSTLDLQIEAFAGEEEDEMEGLSCSVSICRPRS